MEALGAAASAFAVVSLARQLVDSTKRLHGFWSSIEEAPDFLLDVVEDLSFLLTVLTEIANHDQKYGHDPTTTTLLERCGRQIDQLLALTHQFEAGFSSSSRRRRKWTAFRMVFKDDTIKKFYTTLERTKSTLMLARQELTKRQMNSHFEDQNTLLMGLAQNMSQLRMHSEIQSRALTTPSGAGIATQIEFFKVEVMRLSREMSNPILSRCLEKGMTLALTELANSSDDRSIASSEDGLRGLHGKELLGLAEKGGPTQRRTHRKLLEVCDKRTTNVFGTVTFRSRTYRIDGMEKYKQTSNANEETDDEGYPEVLEYTFRVQPAQWLLKLGLRFAVQLAVSQSQMGWTHVIQTFRPIPDDSLIFDFCKVGNVEGIKTLFSRGEASPWDVDSDGWTPLHVGAWHHQVNVCQLMVENGVAADTLTLNDEKALGLATDNLDQTTLWHVRTDKLVDLLRLLVASANMNDEDDDCWFNLYTLTQTQGVSSIIVWIIRLLKPGLIRHAPGTLFSSILFNMFEHESLELEELAFEIFEKRIQALPDYNEFSLLSQCLLNAKYGAITGLISKGANIHCTDFMLKTQSWETLTSLALYSSEQFHAWREIVASTSVDIVKFVDEAVLDPILREQGWTEQSLLSVFNRHFASVTAVAAEYRSPCCDHCLRFQRSNAKSDALDPVVEVRWQLFLTQLKDIESFISDHCSRTLGQWYSGPNYWEKAGQTERAHEINHLRRVAAKLFRCPNDVLDILHDELLLTYRPPDLTTNSREEGSISSQVEPSDPNSGETTKVPRPKSCAEIPQGSPAPLQSQDPPNDGSLVNQFSHLPLDAIPLMPPTNEELNQGTLGALYHIAKGFIDGVPFDFDRLGDELLDFVSISAMPEYLAWSPEELRLVDYSFGIGPERSAKLLIKLRLEWLCVPCWQSLLLHNDMEDEHKDTSDVTEAKEAEDEDSPFLFSI